MMPEFNEYQPELFTLEDEDGQEQTFELLDTYTEDDITYFALIPVQPEGDDASEEDDYFVILKRDDNDPDEFLDSINDEEELDRLAGIFLERLAQESDECECHDENCDCCH